MSLAEFALGNRNEIIDATKLCILIELVVFVHASSTNKAKLIEARFAMNKHSCNKDSIESSTCSKTSVPESFGHGDKALRGRTFSMGPLLFSTLRTRSFSFDKKVLFLFRYLVLTRLPRVFDLVPCNPMFMLVPVVLN